MQSDMAPNPSVVGFSLWAHLPGAGICRARGGSLCSQLMLRVSQSVSGPAPLKTKSSAFCKERQAHSLGCVGWAWNLGAQLFLLFKLYISSPLCLHHEPPILPLWRCLCLGSWTFPGFSTGNQVFSSFVSSASSQISAYTAQPSKCHLFNCVPFLQLWLTSLLRHCFPFSYYFRVLLWDFGRRQR